MSVRVENRKLVVRGGLKFEHPIDASTVGGILRRVQTTGTTAVNVFGSNGAPFALTIGGAFLISQDTTAGNITLKVNGNTVATIAKGTTSGAMVGAVSLSNTTVAAGDAVTVVSSSAGNAEVIITYVPA